MNDWPKLSGETDAQYVYRVCRSKDEIGTWTDVAMSLTQRLAGIRASALTVRRGKHIGICSR